MALIECGTCTPKMDKPTVVGRKADCYETSLSLNSATRSAVLAGDEPFREFHVVTLLLSIGFTSGARRYGKAPKMTSACSTRCRRRLRLDSCSRIERGHFPVQCWAQPSFSSARPNGPVTFAVEHAQPMQAEKLRILDPSPDQIVCCMLSSTDVAVNQNPWYHFGVGDHPF